MWKKQDVRQLCMMAVLAALYAVMDYFSLGIGQTIKVTFAGLPVLIAAICLGAGPGALVGLVGALISQLVRYGLGWMTPLWILPAGLRGLVAGLLFAAFGKRKSLGWLLVPVTISSLLVTAANTLITYLDSLVNHYFTPGLIVGALGFRIVSSVVTSVVYAVVLWPLLKALHHIPALKV